MVIGGSDMIIVVYNDGCSIHGLWYTNMYNMIVEDMHMYNTIHMCCRNKSNTEGGVQTKNNWSCSICGSLSPKQLLTIFGDGVPVFVAVDHSIHHQLSTTDSGKLWGDYVHICLCKMKETGSPSSKNVHALPAATFSQCSIVLFYVHVWGFCHLVSSNMASWKKIQIEWKFLARKIN